MAQESNRSNHAGWVEAIGLPHIVRTLGFAADPGKLGLGALAIILTIVLGVVLDWAWMAASAGVPEDAIVQMTTARRSHAPYDEASGQHGVFEVWRAHETRCVLGLLRLRGVDTPVPNAPVTVDTTLGRLAAPHLGVTRIGSLADMGYGVWWLFRHHTLYFILFGAGTLLIWSLAGGAMCRMTAFQFARDEKLTIKQGLNSARSRLFGGYFLAPCIPLVFALIVGVLLVIGGAVLRIPVLGDVLGGAAFFLAILGGFIIAALLLGLVVGGSLLWPTVATEGSDAFDAFSRSLSYTFSKPWKTVVYAVISVAYAAVCWWFVRWFTFAALAVARTFVAFGTSPFGWWRGEGEQVSKLELIWPLNGTSALYSWPDWASLSWYECISAVLIAIYVLLVAALVWSFLASFYYSATTVVYMLLRRDVDGTELADIYLEEPEEPDTQAPAAQAPVQEPMPSPPPSTSAPEPGPTPETKAGPAVEAEPDTPSENDADSESSPDSSDRSA
jgi:hypothetical protein